MDRLSELQAQVNGANALNSKTSTFLVSDVEIALNQLADQQKRVEQLEYWLNEASSAVGGCDLDSVANIIRKLQAELATRDSEIERLKIYKEFPFGCDNAEHMADEIASLRLTIKDLRWAVQKYGQHTLHCGMQKIGSSCSCGLDDLTKSSEGGG